MSDMDNLIRKDDEGHWYWIPAKLPGIVPWLYAVLTDDGLSPEKIRHVPDGYELINVCGSADCVRPEHQTPTLTKHDITVRFGDCLDQLRFLPDASVDAVVTDPPYGLEFMGKDWDAPWKTGNGFRRAANPADAQRDNAFGRSSRTSPEYIAGIGFQQWCEQWAAECLRVLKPGGHMLAFGGTRTWHRLACAIEDAGFEIRDSIAWLYGSGFPKSLDVSKAIDKRPGVSRHVEFAVHLAERRQAAGLSCADVSERVVGTRSGACWNWEHHQFPDAKWWPALRDLLGLDEVAWGPVVAEAERQRVGERTSGIGTGRGAVPIMGDRNRDVTAPATDAAREWEGWGTALKPAFEPVVVARKPLAGTVAANVQAYGTGALNIDATRVGDDTSRGDRYRGAAPGGSHSMQIAGTRTEAWTVPAGRWPANVCLDGSQADELDQQSGVLHSQDPATRYRSSDPAWSPSGTPRGDHGERTQTTGADVGGASRFFPTFRYQAKAPAKERPKVEDGPSHPTVKPLALMRWLVKLVTPPGGLVLDPFGGSGTTGEACALEGFHCLLIERDPDYSKLIKVRMDRIPAEVSADHATMTEDGDDPAPAEAEG